MPDFSSPAASSYLDQLLSLPLKSLLDEATVISSEVAGVENELTNLCFREYPTFISVHKCSSAVTSAFDDFSSSLGKLLDAVPALEDECRTFVKSTKGVQAARSKALLVQEHQDKLFDLLEIPQLMDTCVRNGYYQEALELSAHAKSLSKRYPGVELVQDVSKEVEAVLQVMVAQLLALLREPIKLPSLIKTVGYLRRLGSVEETKLGLVFLVSRLSNFRAHQPLLEGDRGDPVRYVRKYVDLYREHVFDIISQFTTIFLESSNPPPAAASHLSSFVGQCVDDLVQLVAEYVPKMTHDAASLSSILVQLGYCSLAFARVGLDFASLVTEPFNEAVSKAYSQSLDEGASAFTTTLKDAVKSAGSQTAAVIAGEYIPSLMSKDDPLDWIKWSGSYEQLPTELSRLPPLAMLVNAHLSALNSLRLLAPLHLYPTLAGVQSASLLACTHALAQYVRGVVAIADTDQGQKHQFLRRGERELSPEERKRRRKETQWVCVALADSWIRIVCPLLAQALEKGVYEGSMPTETSPELKEALHTLQTWIDDQIDNHMGSTSPRKSREVERPPPAKEEEPVDAALPTEEEIAALEAPAQPASPIKSPSPVKTPELVMDTTADSAAAAAPGTEDVSPPAPEAAETAVKEEAQTNGSTETATGAAEPSSAPEEPAAEAAAVAAEVEPSEEDSKAAESSTAPPPDDPQVAEDDAPPAAAESAEPASEATPSVHPAANDGADPIAAAGAAGAAGVSDDHVPEDGVSPAAPNKDETLVPAVVPSESAISGQEGQDGQDGQVSGEEGEGAEGKASQSDNVPPPADSADVDAGADVAPAESDDEDVNDEGKEDAETPAAEAAEPKAETAPAPSGGGGGGKKKKKNKKRK